MHLRKTQLQEIKYIVGEANRSLYNERKIPKRINQAFTPNNIIILKDQDDNKRIKEIIETCENKRKLRANNVILGCWVIQPNETIHKEDYGTFFAESFNFVKERYGEIFNGYIHQDELNPHCHLLFPPYIKGTKTLNAKKVLNRNECRMFHRDFENYMSEKLGYKVIMRNESTIRDEKGKAFTVKDLGNTHKLIENNKRLQKELEDTRFVIKETLEDLKVNSPVSYKNFNVTMNKVIEKKSNIFYKVKNFFKNLFHKKNKYINNERQLIH